MLDKGEVSFAWIMQPALFDIPEGVDSRDIRLARDMIAANEEHVELARSGGFDTIWVEDHMGWGEKAHLECFTNMAWLAGRHPGLRYGTMVCGQRFGTRPKLGNRRGTWTRSPNAISSWGSGPANTGPSPLRSGILSSPPGSARPKPGGPSKI